MCIRDRNITGVKVQWEPGQEFKNLRDDAEFNLVASRSAQAAVIKAIKEGKNNVDLNAPTTPDNTPGGSTQVVQTPVRPAAMAKAQNQAAARAIQATALNSPRINWLGC